MTSNDKRGTTRDSQWDSTRLTRRDLVKTVTVAGGAVVFAGYGPSTASRPRTRSRSASGITSTVRPERRTPPSATPRSTRRQSGR